ncbi:MAG: hypothetical protein WB660_03190 [Candidatus Sulfotelmatobacter sp.]
MSPSAVTPNGSAATAKLTISTTASVAQAIPPRSSQNRLIYAIWIQLQGVGLFGVILIGSKSRSKKLFSLIFVGLALTGLLFMSACAGGTGIAQVPQAGTTPGTYTVTVTGASGGLQHSLPLTLIIQ